MTWLRFALTGVLAASLVGPAWGQPARKRKGFSKKGSDGAFEKAKPAVGDTLPAVSIYDQEGVPIDTRDLVKGKYTVLVFGCLT